MSLTGVSDDLRLPIIHAIGCLTAYRLSATTPTSRVATLAIPLSYLPYQGVSVQMRECLQWLDTWGQTDPAASPLLRPWYASLDKLDAHLSLGRVEACLNQLKIESIVTGDSEGGWALSRSSLPLAVELCPRYSTRNVTAIWVDRVMTADSLRKLSKDLAYRARRSADFNEIDELINRYWLVVIQRDGFARRLAEGRPPTPSDLRHWVYRSALSQWRDEGRDALTRGLKGCRTEKDLALISDEEVDAHALHQDVVGRSLPSCADGVFMADDGDGHLGSLVSGVGLSLPLLDTTGGDMEAEMVHRLTLQRGVERVLAAATRVAGNDAGRAQRLLEGMRAEEPIKAIAASEGVSRNRIVAMVADLREVLRTSTVHSDVARRILAFVQEEPGATIDDMEAPTEMARIKVRGKARWSGGGLGVPVSQDLLLDLVAEGFLRRSAQGAYTITHRGAEVLEGNSRPSTSALPMFT